MKEDEDVLQDLLENGGLTVSQDMAIESGLSAIKYRENQRSLAGEEAFAGWTYCYNLPLFARRVHDILAVVALTKRNHPKAEIDLVGLDGAGHWVAGAVAQSKGNIARGAINTGGFRFDDLTDVYGPDFMPGAAKYGDLPGLLALGAPTSLWLAGEGKTAPDIVDAAYSSSGETQQVSVFSGKQSDSQSAAVKWLIE